MTEPFHVSPAQVCFVLVSGWLALLAFHRLFRHPLAKFPGPKLAAVTTWYEGYYDVIHKGRYLWEIERMHKKYGTYRLCLGT